MLFYFSSCAVAVFNFLYTWGVILNDDGFSSFGDTHWFSSCRKYIH